MLHQKYHVQHMLSYSITIMVIPLTLQAWAGEIPMVKLPSNGIVNSVCLALRKSVKMYLDLLRKQ